MQQLSPDSSSSEASGSIIQLDFDKLYEDYQKSIERYLLKQGHDQESARDLCQDTFEHFLNYLSRHETDLPQTEYHVKNLLYHIAENIRIDDYRRKKPISQLLPESDAYTQFEELLIDDKLWLREEIARVPPKYRVCVVLKYYYGYSQKQIAAKLGISPAAVSMNVSRGIEYLRRKYYPVAIDLQREIQNWRQDAEKVLNCMIDDIDILLTKFNLKAESIPPKQITFMEKSAKRVINYVKSENNSWAKLVSAETEATNLKQPPLIQP